MLAYFLAGERYLFNHGLCAGSSPVDITDPRWDMYLAVRKTVDESGDIHYLLLGFATVYHFYHYPDASRLRIGQVGPYACN